MRTGKDCFQRLVGGKKVEGFVQMTAQHAPGRRRAKKRARWSGAALALQGVRDE